MVMFDTKNDIEMRKRVFLLILFATLGLTVDAANVVFRASAPQAVAMGENFRISYTVNAEGKDLRVPELSAFDVLYGPTTSNSMSTQIINGSTAGITHTGTQTAHKLINNGRNTALKRHATLNTFRH